MNLSSKTIVLLTLAGLALLVSGGMFFSAPLFGQVILASIVLIFLVSQFRYYKILGHIETESALLPQYRQQVTPDPIGDGIIAKRIEKAKELSHKRFFPEPRVFSETLAATETGLVSRSPGGIVVMLGLMGTFYGLMVAVSTAGGTLNTSSEVQTTLQSIQQIFSSMQGIFGTSLAGLVAALVLNATHAVLSSAQTRLWAQIEEYTQFQLLPAFAPSNDPAERQMELMVEKLGQVTQALQQGIQERNEQSLQLLRTQVEESTLLLRDGLQSELRSMFGDLSRLTQQFGQSLESSGATAQEKIHGVLDLFRQDFTQMQQSATQGIESAVSVVNTQLRGQLDAMVAEFSALHQSATNGLRTTVDQLVQGISSQAHAQVEHSKELMQASEQQWNGFMESLRHTSAESLVHQKEGLSTLREVAEQVAVKALDESANLSSTFAAQIEKLSSEVQSSFGQLAGVSRELIEAQGRLLQEMEARIHQEKEAASGFAGDLGEAATLMRINQSEFQASLEMFRLGVEQILEKFTGNTAEQESQRNFVDQLHASLEAFHEKASEVLVENAMRTQEILLEVLEQSRPVTESKAES